MINKYNQISSKTVYVSTFLFAVPVSFLIMFSGCSLYRSMQARKLLSKCDYRLEKVALKTFEFAPVITFDNRKNTLNFEKPSKDLIPLLDDIKNKRFNLKLNTLSFTTYVQITNPNKQEVELDSMFFKGYLDKQFVATILHREHTIIPPGRKKSVKMYLSVPLSIPLENVTTAKNVVLDGKVWLKLAIVGKKSVTIPFTVTVKKKIPRKKLDDAIKKKKSEIVRNILKGLHKDAPAIIDKGKALFEKMF